MFWYPYFFFSQIYTLGPRNNMLKYYLSILDFHYIYWTYIFHIDYSGKSSCRSGPSSVMEISIYV